MTGHDDRGSKPIETGKEGTLTEAGGPYSQVHTTSGDPYVSLAKPGVLERLDQAHSTAPTAMSTSTPAGEKTAAGEPLGSSSTATREPLTGSHATTTEPLGTSHAATESHLGSSNTTTGDHLGSSTTAAAAPIGTSNTATERHLDGSNTTTGEHLGSSTAAAAAVPIGTAAATTGDHMHSDNTTTGKDSVNTGLSDASIKSGVIGFGPSETTTHAALPTHFAEEQNLHRDHVVGGGNLGAGESTTQGVNPTTESQALPRTYMAYIEQCIVLFDSLFRQIPKTVTQLQRTGAQRSHWINRNDRRATQPTLIAHFLLLVA